MKMITASELKNSPSELFDALLTDGEVILTRNGKEFPLKLIRDQAEQKTKETGLSRIVKAVTKLAESIPEEKREEVHDSMMAELENLRSTQGGSR